MHKDNRAERKETSPRIKWELEIKYVDVCYAAQHEPETAGISNSSYLQQKQLHLVVPKKSMIVVFVRAIGFGTRWFVNSRPASRSNT